MKKALRNVLIAAAAGLVALAVIIGAAVGTHKSSSKTSGNTLRGAGTAADLTAPTTPPTAEPSCAGQVCGGWCCTEQQQCSLQTQTVVDASGSSSQGAVTAACIPKLPTENASDASTTDSPKLHAGDIFKGISAPLDAVPGANMFRCPENQYLNTVQLRSSDDAVTGITAFGCSGSAGLTPTGLPEGGGQQLQTAVFSSWANGDGSGCAVYVAAGPATASLALDVPAVMRLTFLMCYRPPLGPYGGSPATSSWRYSSEQFARCAGDQRMVGLGVVTRSSAMLGYSTVTGLGIICGGKNFKKILGLVCDFNDWFLSFTNGRCSLCATYKHCTVIAAAAALRSCCSRCLFIVLHC
jgi:hypothetical protein